MTASVAIKIKITRDGSRQPWKLSLTVYHRTCYGGEGASDLPEAVGSFKGEAVATVPAMF